MARSSQQSQRIWGRRDSGCKKVAAIAQLVAASISVTFEPTSASRCPWYDDPLDERDSVIKHNAGDSQQQERRKRQRRARLRGRHQNEIAEPLRPDELADDGADHRKSYG